MKIEIEQHADIAVLIVTKGLLGVDADDLVSTVQHTLEEGTRKFVVDLEDVGRFDSSGLGSLFVAYTSVVKLGGKMVLVLPEKFFNPNMLVIHQLVPVFEIYKSQEEAIEALRNPKPTPDHTESKTQQDFPGFLIAACVFLIVSAMALVGKLLPWVYHWISALIR